MLAVRSGREGLDTWHTEVRNYLLDIKTTTGESPPPVESVTIMTDGDNTRSSATAYFELIEFRRKPPSSMKETATRCRPCQPSASVVSHKVVWGIREDGALTMTDLTDRSEVKVPTRYPGTVRQVFYVAQDGTVYYGSRATLMRAKPKG